MQNDDNYAKNKIPTSVEKNICGFQIGLNETLQEKIFKIQTIADVLRIS